jgi:hypothetical protein
MLYIENIFPFHNIWEKGHHHNITSLLLYFLQISVPHSLWSYLQLKPRNFDLELMKLTQFDILNRTVLVGNNATRMTAYIYCQRQLMYYLANIYLPTISLLVIVEMTLFFDLSRQEVAVTLSLTVLPVMYTFYQSISTRGLAHYCNHTCLPCKSYTYFFL